jgi:hypothetical protein
VYIPGRVESESVVESMCGRRGMRVAVFRVEVSLRDPDALTAWWMIWSGKTRAYVQL